MSFIHKNLASGRWQKLSFAEQMGNIGAEVNRVIHWHKTEDKENKEKALWRALELIDLTILNRKSVELFRLREVLCDLFLNKNNYKVSTEYLKEYFLQFALYARKGA